MRTRQMMVVTLGCLMLWATTAAVASEHMHSMKTGKKGEITLTKATKVGDIVLQPDTYVVQHRTSGDDHFFRFIELKKVTDWNPSEGAQTYTEADKAGEIKCRVEPAAAPVKETMVSMEGDRITKIAIKGEDVVHIF